MEKANTARLLLKVRGMVLFRGVLEAPAARHMLVLLGLLSSEEPDAGQVAGVFGRLWEELALNSGDLLPDAWQSYLMTRILADENPFSLAAERVEQAPHLVEQASRDLRTLRELFDLDGPYVLALVEEAVPGLDIWVPWTASEPAEADSSRHTLARKLAAAENWDACDGLLADYYARYGAGPFGLHRAFRWQEGRLRAVTSPDPVRLADLVGYEREREPLLENTRRFLAGRPAHHALLYGLPGTGKSSTVKAVANEFADDGLRLVELAKGDLGELPRLLDALRDRGPRFVLFVDDLSFEEHEVEYKSLKALLEGSVAQPPENVRLYATSNRRNIVRERFSDREDNGFADEVHVRDTMHEKLSLAARFGLRLTFPTPDQERYLEIVRGLARERGIGITGEDLDRRALLWDRWHAGRSGRTARQFVDELEAGLP